VAKRLRCYLGMHRWVRKSRERKSYEVCRDCGREMWPDERYIPPPDGGGGGGGFT